MFLMVLDTQAASWSTTNSKPSALISLTGRLSADAPDMAARGRRHARSAGQPARRRQRRRRGKQQRTGWRPLQHNTKPLPNGQDRSRAG